MDFNTDLGQATKLGARLTVLAMAVALAACGGGGASDAVKAPTNNTGGGTNQPAASQYALTLSTDKPSLKISGDTVTITATALEKIGGGRVAGQSVQLVLPDAIKNGLSIAGASKVETNASGQAVFVLQLDPNSTVEQQALLTKGLDLEVILVEANGAEVRQRTVLNVVQPGTQVSAFNLDISTDKQIANVNGDTIAVTLRVSDSSAGGVADQQVSLGIPNGLRGVIIDGASKSVTDSAGNAVFSVKIAEGLTPAEIDTLVQGGISLAATLIDNTGAEKLQSRFLTAARPTSQYNLLLEGSAPTLNVFGDELTLSVQASAIAGASITGQSITIALANGTPTGVQFEGNTTAETDAQGIAQFKLKLVAGLSQQSIDALLAQPITIDATLTERSGAKKSTRLIVPVSQPVIQNMIRLDMTKNVLIASGDTMQAIATVLDKNNGAVAGQRVTLKLEATDGVAIEGSSTVLTDDKGLATFNIRLNERLSTAERDALILSGIKVTATLVESSGASMRTLPQAISVRQSGTNPVQSNLDLKLRLSPPQINILGDQIDLTVLASTPQGLAAAGQAVTIGLPALAGLSLTGEPTVTTNTTGQATFRLTLSNTLSAAERSALLANGLPITATLTEANGATRTISQSIAAFEPTASYQLSLVSSASPLNVRGDTATVRVQVLDQDLRAVVNRPVKVWLSSANNIASLLTINGQPANLLVDIQTNAQGVAEYEVAIPASLTLAQRNSLLQGVTANVIVIEQSGARNVFTQVLSVAEPTSSLALGLQANKASINAASSDSFDVIVTLRDAENRAVAGQQLSFALSDIALRQGVTVAATTASTDANGSARFTVNSPAGLDVTALNGLLGYAVSLSAANGAMVTQTGMMAVVQPTARYALRLNANKIVKTSGDTFKVFAQAVDDTGNPIANQRVQLLVNDPIRTGVTVTGEAEIVTNTNGLAEFELTLTPGANVNQLFLSAGIGLTARLTEDSGVQSRQALIVPVDTLNTTGQYRLSWTQSKAAFTGFGDEIAVTYRVTDANGGVLAGVPVALRIEDALIAGATLTTSSRLVTDADGLVTTTVRLTGRDLDAVIGSNTVTLIAEVQAASFNAQGVPTVTTLASQNISLSKGDGADFTLETSLSVMRAGESTVLTAKLIDSDGMPVAGAPVEFIDEVTGAAFVLGTLTTGIDGTVQARLAFSQLSFDTSGRARISAVVRGSASELRTDEAIEIVSASDASFSFISLPNTVSSVDTAIPVTLRVRAPTATALNGELVFNTSLGRVSTSSNVAPTSNQVRVLLDGTATGTESGLSYRDVTVFVSSSFPGVAVLNATYQRANQPIDRVVADIRLRAVVPAKLMLQADQTVLVPNQSTRIVAIVKDANDSPVSGAVVRFERLVDTSAGRLSSSTAITNDAGVATVTYTAGTSAPLDRVEVNAIVESDPSIRPQPGMLTLTVAQQAAYITVGNSDRLRASDDNIYYYHPYSMAVVDGSGRPVPNQAVSVQLFATEFAKGFWQTVSVVQPNGTIFNNWQRFNYQECDTEDQNRNFTLDSGEDRNGNGRVEVANPVAIIADNDIPADANGVVTFVTDAEGKFDFEVRYPKIYSQWMRVEMKATTRVFGSELASVTVQGLPVLADDVTIGDNATRPNIESPFGTVASCNSPD